MKDTTQQTVNELKECYENLSEVIKLLRDELVLETRPIEQKRLERQITAKETERTHLEHQIEKLEHGYNSHILHQYAAAMVTRYQNISFLGIPDLRDKKEIPLKSIFVELMCTDIHRGIESRVMDIDYALSQEKNLVILGDPGAGKSTLLKYQTLAKAQKLETVEDKITQGAIPIIIVLRNYASTKQNLLDYYYHHCACDLSLKLPENFLEKLLEQGLCSVYFDGYDELAGGIVRENIRNTLQIFAEKYPKNRFILTSRIAGYERVPLNGKKFNHVKLMPFTENAIKLFVEKWYAWKAKEMGISDRERNESINDLQASLKNGQVQKLASNPLMLTMIAIIHRNEARLPNERYKLYEKVTEALLETWENYKKIDDTNLPIGKKQSRLAHIAQWMHSHSQGKENRQAEVERRDIEKELTKYLIEEEYDFRNDKHKAKAEAKNFLDFINQRAGLLVEQGDQLYRFLHLSFQEYFTAFYYLEQELGKREIWETLYKEKIPNSHYNEVLLLLFAMLIENKQTKKATHILQQCRKEYWSRLQVEPEKISRTMIIEDIQTTTKNMGDGYYNLDAQKFIIFMRNALNDCVRFETEERENLENTLIKTGILLVNVAMQGARIIFLMDDDKNSPSPSFDIENFNLALVYTFDKCPDFYVDFALVRTVVRYLFHPLARDLSRTLSCASSIASSTTVQLFSFSQALFRISKFVHSRANEFDCLHKDSFFIYSDSFRSLMHARRELAKVLNTSVVIKNIEKRVPFLQGAHGRYVQYASLVFLVMSVVVVLRQWYKEEDLPWHYPNLDVFMETCGGLLVT